MATDATSLTHADYPAPAELPLVLRVDEVAAALRIGRRAAYDLVERGELSSVRVGRSIRVSRAALLSFIEGY